MTSFSFLNTTKFVNKVANSNFWRWQRCTSWSIRGPFALCQLGHNSQWEIWFNMRLGACHYRLSTEQVSVSLFMMPLIRRLLCAEHRKQQTSSSVGHATEEQLLMVNYAPAGNKTVLRTVDELESPGEIKYSIPYRGFCGFSRFQGWLTFLG